MRNVYLLLFCLFLYPFFTSAQSPVWGWAKNSNSPGGFSHAEGNSIATDTWGNVYTTGSYENPITFGAGLMPEPAFGDYFLVKHNRAGGILWNRWALGTGFSTTGNSVTTDINGNVLVTGSFSRGIAVFGTDTLRTDSTGGMFLVKYDTAGNVLWARSGIGSCLGHSVTTDGAGNIYIAGGFYSTVATFSGITLYNDSISGYYNQFFIKYSPTGNIIWCRSNSAGVSGAFTRLSATEPGYIYLLGTFSSSRFTIGGATLYNYSSTSPLTDIYLARYDTAGNLIWARSAGGNNYDNITGVASDQYGNAYISGNFTSDSIQFGTNTLRLDTSGVYTSKMYLVKYDSSGNAVWARSDHATYMSNAKSVVLNVTDEPCISGYFYSTNIIFGTDTFYANGNFVVQYDTAGTVQWAKGFGDHNSEVYAITRDGANNLLLTGYQIGNLVIGNDTLFGSTGGVEDVFVAKLVWLTEDVKLTTTTINPLKAYPVPTNGILNISLGEGNFIALNMYDATGKKVYSNTLDPKTNEFQLNTARFADGVYIIHALRNDGVNYQKVVIQH